MLESRLKRWTSGAKPKTTKPKRRFPPEVLTDAEVRALMDACGRCANGCAQWSPDRSAVSQRVAHQRGAGVLSKGHRLRQRRNSSAARKGRQVTGGRQRRRSDRARAALADDQTAMGGQGLPSNLLHQSALRLGEGYIRQLFPSLGRMVGIQKRVHPHGLRHTHAAQLREEGIAVGIISKKLGHVSIATTAMYLDHIAPAALLKTISKRHW